MLFGQIELLLTTSLHSLRDRDDDVRSAAAATLAPITDALVNRLPVELEAVVGILWNCLGDLKDDLSSSIGGVMDLLGVLFLFLFLLGFFADSLGTFSPCLQPTCSPSPPFSSSSSPLVSG